MGFFEIYTQGYLGMNCGHAEKITGGGFRKNLGPSLHKHVFKKKLREVWSSTSAELQRQLMKARRMLPASGRVKVEGRYRWRNRKKVEPLLKKRFAPSGLIWSPRFRKKALK